MSTKKMIDTEREKQATEIGSLGDRSMFRSGWNCCAAFMQSPEFMRAFYEQKIAELEGRNIDIRKAIHAGPGLPEDAKLYDLAPEHRENSHVIQACQILMKRLEAL